MLIDGRLGCFFLVALLLAGAASAQETRPAAQAGGDRIYLDVVVAPKSGAAVGDLQQQEFTLLDNKAPQTITSFKAVSGREASIEVIVVIDAVNTDAQHVGYEIVQIDKFLRAEGGHLAYPAALAIFTDRGFQILGGDFSRDGNALSAALDKNNPGLRDIGRSAGYYGATERLQLSLDALRKLVASEAARPGRKLILWVSPGWPLLSGPATLLDAKQEQQVFADIVSIANQLLAARVTLYSINPLGTGESLGRASYYEDFLKGVSKPSQVNLGNLGLPVLAIQSGGLAFDLSNDVTSLLQQCVADSAPYYEISFDPSLADRRDEYHHLEVKLDKPGLTARTRQGYYAEPSASK